MLVVRLSITVTGWDLIQDSTGKELLIFKGHTGYVKSVIYSSAGRRIASGSVDRTAKIWEADTGTELLTLTGHTADVNCLCFNRDDSRLATGSADRTVRVWDAHTGKEIHCLEGHASPVIGVCFNPDGAQVISREIDGRQITWDLATGKPATSEGMYTPPWSPRSPDGRSFALREDMVVRIHRLAEADHP
jgi:WD40 repeat protein